MRLAETFLLRAEAHYLNGSPDKAVLDINTIRTRAKALSVDASDVDLDFILDERARELYFEEFRLITLMCKGKLAERVGEKDPFHNGKYETHRIDSHNNLWPIPQSE